MQDRQLETVREYFSDGDAQIMLGMAIEDSYRWAMAQPHRIYDDPADLSSQIKTSIGSMIEECALAYLGLPKVSPLDSEIDGVTFDFKHSMNSQWMIPQEAVGHVCVLIGSDWHGGTFDLGVIRTDEEVLTRGTNQDKKKTIRSTYRKDPAIWIAKGLTFRAVA